jgi:hypothetical protein
MALSKTLTLSDNFGEIITFNNAYIQVSKVDSDKNNAYADVTISRSPAGQPLQQRQFKFSLDLEGPNPIKQAYEHLKTLPEFADAVDC